MQYGLIHAWTSLLLGTCVVGGERNCACSRMEVDGWRASGNGWMVWNIIRDMKIVAHLGVQVLATMRTRCSRRDHCRFHGLGP